MKQKEYRRCWRLITLCFLTAWVICPTLEASYLSHSDDMHIFYLLLINLCILLAEFLKAVIMQSHDCSIENLSKCWTNERKTGKTDNNVMYLSQFDKVFLIPHVLCHY